MTRLPSPVPLSLQLAQAAEVYDPRTLLVAFFGGPGTGKSTTTALTFGTLKQRGRNVEQVGEVAKDFTWEERAYALSHQPYIAAKQMRNWDRLEGKVDAILTDTSTLYSIIYWQGKMTEAASKFRDWLVADWQSRRVLNVMLARDSSAPYNPAGRSQSEDEAVVLDEKIRSMLVDFDLPFIEVPVDRGGSTHIETIVSEIERRIP